MCHWRQGNESTLEIHAKHPKHVIPNAREESVLYCNGLRNRHRLRLREILHCAENDLKGRFGCKIAPFNFLDANAVCVGMGSCHYSHFDLYNYE